MRIRTGIDTVETTRIAALMEKSGSRFLRRHFTEPEIEYCMSKPDVSRRFAGRFAAKEAVYKAIGLNWSDGFSWKHIEILPGMHGRPEVFLHGNAELTFRDIGGDCIDVSITLVPEYASAVAFFLLP